jgi:hypothetical protein
MPTAWWLDLDADLPTHLDVDFGFRREVVLDERLYAPLILR